MKKIKKIYSKMVSSFFYTGYFPLFPGTFASLITLSFIYLVVLQKEKFAFYLPYLFFFLFLILGINPVNDAIRESGQKDPQWVVVDEVLGQSLSLFFIPLDLKNIFLAFLLFRFFDISKIYPINRLEKLKGSLGVFMDDILSGIFANIVLQVIIRIL